MSSQQEYAPKSTAKRSSLLWELGSTPPLETPPAPHEPVEDEPSVPPTQAMKERASILYRAFRQREYTRTDRSFAFLMLGQWVALIIAAFLLSARTESTESFAPTSVWLALLLGAAITAPPVILGQICPGRPFTRYVIAISQMLLSALIIQISGGRSESHFHVFGSLAFLAFYLDWRVLALASTVIGVDHAIRGVYFPETVFGTGIPQPYRWIEHLGWITFTDLFLILGIRQRLKEMRRLSERQARLEIQTGSAQERANALSASEERFRQLADNLRQVLWIVDRNTNALLYVSPAYEELWGRSRQSLYDDPRMLLETIHEEDRDRLIAALSKQAAGRSMSAEVRVIRPDGTVRWVVTRSFPVADENGKSSRVIGVTEDITDRKAEETRRTQELERERRIAAALQSSLLMLPPAGALPGVSVDTVHVPARRDEALVSGDFFDAFPVESSIEAGRPLIAMVVGDISGKGLAAAARTAEVKYALRAYLRDTPSASDAMTRLNRFVCETQALEERQFGTFIALTVVVMDSASGEARVAQAGAEPALLLRHGERIAHGKVGPASVEIVGDVTTGGLPLGVDPHANYDSLRVLLRQGDILMLSSDGLGEARNADQTMLGTEGLAKLFCDAGALPYGIPLQVIGEFLLSGARTFTGGAFQDDVCVLLARR